MSRRLQTPEHAFASAVTEVVRSLSRGETVSYAEVARRAGYSGAARAVGSLMRKNHDPSVPCHRVIRSDGRCGEYNGGGEQKKAERLEQEGIALGMRIVAGQKTWYIKQSIV
ncbi:MAG: MGMT family protein [Candidatus Moranbacteria bacterium]|nr:MGMT family protein [Candidatus Moranbacteria bacterium]MBP6033908.1 MGMT family protein [Candidatus Moranbacteria bacterium]MBP7695633.1 MGMT family protein [Candidatus Moranbacteria bacterium]